MKDLHLTLIQAELAWETPEKNRQIFQERLLPLSGKTDLVILPEMFTTGFSMHAAEQAETMEGPTVQWLQWMAQKMGAVITGSFIAKDNEHFFNRLLWVRPDGTFQKYDKRHLFSYANEHHHYTKGQNHLIVELKGWKVLPLICYDLRFPVWSRNTQGYDLLIYVANWPQKRSFAWTSLLTARAIENQAYTIGVNRVGTDANDIAYSGDSRVIDFSGQPILTAAQQEQVLSAILSKEKLLAFRDRFRFLQDQDDFRIIGE